VLEPATGPPAALAASWRAAFAPGHPDFHGQTERQTARELDALLRGAIIGPPLPCSVQARAADGRLCGAALVNAAAGAAPAGGPWLSELFRDPRVRGTGRALLRRALADASRDGLPTMGLVVTDGNPAEGLYREHGFARAVSSLTVRLP
jgi:GNAT superfamily N-acetyltransferase